MLPTKLSEMTHEVCVSRIQGRSNYIQAFESLHSLMKLSHLC